MLSRAAERVHSGRGREVQPVKREEGRGVDSGVFYH